MRTPSTGERVAVDASASHVVVHAPSGRPALGAATVVETEGSRPTVTHAAGDAPWTLAVDARPDAATDVYVYMTDDAEIGRVEDRGAITITVGGETFALPTRTERHGAVYVGRIYTRSGRRLLRMGGEGYAMGVHALARKLGVDVREFGARAGRGETPHAPRAYERDRPRSGDRATGSGSGVVVAPGHVVTNAHVVRDARRLEIVSDGRRLEGRLLAVDEGNDLALLKVDGLTGDGIHLRPIGAGYSGEAIIAAGYPLRDLLNEDLKITRGNVSSLRGLHGDVGALQFTAAIASGSSGGAVVDEAGRLVGVVSAALSHETIRSNGGTSEGVNFAVKASLVAEMATAAGVETRMSEKGEATTPQLLTAALRREVVSILTN